MDVISVWVSGDPDYDSAQGSSVSNLGCLLLEVKVGHVLAAAST